jgi:hypothetical protein
MTRARAQSNRTELGWLAALGEPARVLAWTLTDWEHNLRLARRLRLLGRLAEALDAAALFAAVPERPRRHLVAELRYARWRGTAMRWVLDRVSATLADLNAPRLLLKGAAYVGQGLSLGVGRLPSDVDILVPKASVDRARALLIGAGWEEAELDTHDQRYYREWSHELPPMRHPVHGLELDLHHDILPPVSKVRVDISLLLADAQPASAMPGWHVFSRRDQILHAAAHLFHDSELRDRIRDLVDIDVLLRLGTTETGFWDSLLQRSVQLGLQESLALALVLCQRWLDSPVPEAVLERARADGLPGPLRLWLPALMSTALYPVSPDALPSWQQHAAARLVLLRHHLGRMPLHMLMRHTAHKLLRRGDIGSVQRGNGA